MGMGGISIWQLLIILLIVLLLFGTKRLKSIGSDLGNAIKGFRAALSESEQEREARRLEEVGASHREAGQKGSEGNGKTRV